MENNNHKKVIEDPREREEEEKLVVLVSEGGDTLIPLALSPELTESLRFDFSQTDFHGLLYSSDVLHLEIKDGIWQSFKEGVRRGYHQDVQITDDGYLHAHLSIQPIEVDTLPIRKLLGKGRFFGVSNQTFITDAKRQLEEGLERERFFFEGVEHDIRNALQSGGDLTNSLYDKLDKGQNIPKEILKDYIGVISRSFSRTRKTLETLLTLERLKAGYSKIERSRFYIHQEVISQALESAEVNSAILDRHLVVIDESNLEHKDMMVNADKILLPSLFVNLFHNATKFVPEGGEIAYSGRQCNGYKEFSVFNQGDPITKEMISTMFRPWVSGSGSFGLGLAICGAIIDAHGGKIYGDPNRVEGVKINLTLPD